MNNGPTAVIAVKPFIIKGLSSFDGLENVEGGKCADERDAERSMPMRRDPLPTCRRPGHCRECQKQSASAFGISVEMPKDGLTVTQGTPQFWTRGTDSGRKLRCAFCPDCGTRLWHESDAGWITLKGGSLDAPVDVSDAIHIWTKRKLPGIMIPEGAQQYPGEPV